MLRSPLRDSRTRLLELVATEAETNPTRAELMLARITNVQKLESDNPKAISVSREPRGWVALTLSASSQLAGKATQSNYYVEWPGKEMVAAPVNVRPLTSIELTQYYRGEKVFMICLACHGSNGEGTMEQYPSLVGSERVLGSEERLAKILLHGLMGPIENQGVMFDGMMPAPTLGSDEDIAAVMTYVRRSWGNDADPVEARTVASVRRRNKDRAQPWKAHELDSDQR